MVNKGEISFSYLDKNRIDMFVEEDIDSFFMAVDGCLHN